MVKFILCTMNNLELQNLNISLYAVDFKTYLNCFCIKYYNAILLIYSNI